MSLPISPTNGEFATVNGITFVYNSSSNSWTRVPVTGITAGNIFVTGSNVASSTTTGALVVTGGVGVGGSLYASGIVANSAGISGTIYAGGIIADGVDLVANAVAQANSIAGANAAIITANTALKGYVDTQFTSLVGGAPAVLDTLYEIAESLGNNASLSTTLLNSIAGANAAIVTANTSLKSYVDDRDSAVTTAWTANAATTQSQLTGANAAIVTANTAMKAYSDAQDALITSAWTANAGAQANAITGANVNIAELQGLVYTNSNVAYYLPTYTGNVSAGNVNVTANIYADGNIFSAGSRILTAADLATVTYTADYITNDPTSVTGLTAVAGTSSTYGTYNFGDVTSIQTYGDYDTVANTGFYSVNDATGSPGHVEYIGFTNVAGFNRLNYNINYTANSGHTINFELYNYEYMHWDTFATTTGSGSWQTFTLGVIDDSPYIGTGANLGNVTTRLNHVSSGNVQHRTWIDYVALEQSITGGQGPRGPTGSTGATGATGPAWSGGYVANVTTFGSNLVANSATASTSTSTGALIVVGGAGITGTVYSGGIVANGVDLVANAGVQADAIAGTNAAIITANTAMKAYSDAQDALITSAWTANAATTQSQLAGANAAIITANTAMKGYVDTQFTNVVGGAPAALDTLYEIANSLGNNASLSSTLINSIAGANAAIVTANTSLKSYVDDRDSAVTTAWTANAATQQGLIATLQTQVYSNTNVAAYIPTYTGAITSLSVTASTPSTSTSTGALVVTGGAGIGGNVFATSVYTDNLKFANGNPYTSTTIANTTDITANASSGTNVGLSLSDTGVSANTYGSATSVPVITVDAKGRITSVTTSTISGSLTFTGDVTGTGSTGSSTALTLANSGVTAGNYGSATSIPTIVVDAKGRITSITTNAASSTITLAGTSGSGSVSGGGTLTFASTNGVTISVGSSYANVSTPQDIQTSASPTFAGGSFTGNVTRNSKALITNYTGNTAPSSPIQGDEWFRGNTGVMYKYLYDNVSNTYNWVNYSSALFNANTGAVASTLALRDTGGNLTATNFLGVASSAKYADLAEIYESDNIYQPGTVVVFGGTKEITVTKKTHDTRVAGVISTNPAYLMNSEATGLPVAFTGRVPCLVKGPVSKGDVLVTSAHERYAEKMDNTLYRPGCILGKALGEVAENEFATIEVVVGRF